MNDIITDFIGKALANRIKQNIPISPLPKNQLDKHLSKCKKQICPICSKILKGDNKQ